MKEFIQFCNDNVGFLMTVLTTAYVIATGVVVWLTHKANALAARGTDMAVRLELDRSKPVVVVDFVPDIPFFRLRVRNTGLTTAYNIRFNIAPEPRISLGGDKAIPREKTEKGIHFITKGIASLAPGAELTSALGTLARIEEVHGALQFRGKITYNDHSSNEHSMPVDIDLHIYRDLLYSGRKGVHDVAKSLEDIHRVLNHLATGFSKPHVLTQDIDEYRQEEEKQIEEAKKALDAKVAEQSLGGDSENRAEVGTVPVAPQG